MKWFFTAKKLERELVHDVYLMLDVKESGTGNWKASLPSTIELYLNGCDDQTVLAQWRVICFLWLNCCGDCGWAYCEREVTLTSN